MSPVEFCTYRNLADWLRAVPMLDGRDITTELIIGERKLRAFIPDIGELRLRCGLADDLTTDPQYFITANTLNNRRVVAVLIRRNHLLEGCVFFIEHCIFGIGLGVLLGGDYIGESLVAAAQPLRLQCVQLAAQALLQRRRIFGVGLTIRADCDDCVELMGPASQDRMFSGRSIQHQFRLERTYQAMLAAMGPRTRRSLAGKRQQLEKSAHVIFLPSLEPAQALTAMLALQPNSVPSRPARFHHARYQLLLDIPGFFCMGMQLHNGTWLSMLSGWRRGRVTYVDFQMNDMNFKKESLSAVMRAYMLEHEIARQQELINFVGGTSILLRRYCRPIESCSDVFLWRPGLRTALLKRVIKHLNRESLYTRVNPEIIAGAPDHAVESG